MHLLRIHVLTAQSAREDGIRPKRPPPLISQPRLSGYPKNASPEAPAIQQIITNDIGQSKDSIMKHASSNPCLPYAPTGYPIESAVCVTARAYQYMHHIRCSYRNTAPKAERICAAACATTCGEDVGTWQVHAQPRLKTHAPANRLSPWLQRQVWTISLNTHSKCMQSPLGNPLAVKQPTCPKACRDLAYS